MNRRVRLRESETFARYSVGLFPLKDFAWLFIGNKLRSPESFHCLGVL